MSSGTKIQAIYLGIARFLRIPVLSQLISAHRLSNMQKTLPVTGTYPEKAANTGNIRIRLSTWKPY